jgi:hypothetical protein
MNICSAKHENLEVDVKNFIVVGIVVLLVVAYLELTSKPSPQDLSPNPAYTAPPARTPVASRPEVESFACDGRTRCSQMHSCAEATFFIRNCPGTEMDGDHDGVPCERQWCQ